MILKTWRENTLLYTGGISKKLEDMQVIQQPSIRSLWTRQIPAYILSHLAPLLVGLASISLLPRFMGPEKYGTYALIIVTIRMVASVLSDWLVATGIRLSAESSKLKELIWPSLSWIALLFSLLGGFLVSALLVNQLSISVWFAAIFLTTSLILSKPFVAYIRATLKGGFIFGYAMISSIGSLILSLYLYVVTQNLVWFIVGLSVVPWVAFLLYSIKFKWFIRYPKLSCCKDILGFGLPIAITSIGGQILQFADRYILAIYKTHTDVGVYNATYNLSDKVLGLGFSILFSSMYPVGSRAWAQGKRTDAKGLLIHLFNLMTIFAGAFIWFQAVAGVSLISWLTGHSFHPPSLMPILVSLGGWLWFTGILQHQPLEWDKRTLWITAMTLVTATINIVLNVLLVPLWGMLGSAMATLVSYASYLAFCTWVVRRYKHGAIIWKSWAIAGTGLGALLLWYRFQGNAGLWQGVLAALCFMIIGLISLFLTPKRRRKQV